jgi:hypothetical protein
MKLESLIGSMGALSIRYGRSRKKKPKKDASGEISTSPWSPCLTPDFISQEDFERLTIMRSQGVDATKDFLAELYDKYDLNRRMYKIATRDGSITKIPK